MPKRFEHCPACGKKGVHDASGFTVDGVSYGSGLRCRYCHTSYPEGIQPTMTTFDDQRREMIESGQPEADAIVALTSGEQTWDTEALRAEFDALSFAAPFIIVRRKSDGRLGSLEFTHSPRVYFNWTPHDE